MIGMSEARTQTPPRSMHAVWRLAAATTLIVMAFAATNPVLAVVLQQRGHSTVLVGVVAMIPFACVGLLIPLMPRVLSRFGMVRAYRWGCALEVLGAVGYALGVHSPWYLPVWLVSAVLGGVGAAALWNATEALLAQNAPPERRGRVTALYQTILGAALALGPFVPVFMPAIFGASAQQVLWLAALVVATAWGLAALTQAQAAAAGAGAAEMGTWAAMRLLPALVLIAFAGGVFEAGLGSVSAAHGASLGMSLATAATIVGAIGVGSFAFQYPAGMLADALPARTVFGAAGALLLACSLGFAFSAAWPWLTWLAALAWGGVGGALYTLTMIRVAHQFPGASAASGTAAMITGYTSGGALGPPLAGAALQAGGAVGLALLLGLLALAVCVAARRVHSHTPV
jgi:MFS family permease